MTGRRSKTSICLSVYLLDAEQTSIKRRGSGLLGPNQSAGFKQADTAIFNPVNNSGHLASVLPSATSAKSTSSYRVVTMGSGLVKSRTCS